MRAFAKRPAVLALIAGSLTAAAGLTSSSADARTVVSVGIGGPAYGWYGPPPYPYGPPPYYYAPPPPVYVAPPVTYVVPPPVQAAPGPAPSAAWYYCDDPQGYYPYVPNCNGPWRPVQPTPQ